MRHSILASLLASFAVLISPCSPSFAEQSGTHSIQGIWELARVDGIQPQDIPPGGFSNLLVEFNAEKGVRSGLPGQLDTEAFRPYRTEHGKTEHGELVAWLGLSNNRTTPRRYSFLSEDWLEIDLPVDDGFVALFRRIKDSSPVKQTCVGFSLADRVAPEVIRSEKEALVTWTPGPIPSELRGTWSNKTGSGLGASKAWILTLDVDTAELTIQSKSFASLKPTKTAGTAGASGGFLSAEILACGALIHYRLEGDRLTLSHRNLGEVTLRRD